MEATFGTNQAKGNTTGGRVQGNGQSRPLHLPAPRIRGKRHRHPHLTPRATPLTLRKGTAIHRELRATATIMSPRYERLDIGCFTPQNI